MARNEDVTLTAGTWTQLTADDASLVCGQNKSGYAMTVMATTSASAPSATSRAGYLVQPFKEFSFLLAAAFPGLTSPVRMYAVCDHATIPVFVSHD